MIVTEKYLNGTYYKYYRKHENKSLVFMLPGATMSPRAFWDFKTPENKYVDPETFDPYVYLGSYIVHTGNVTATLYLTQTSGASRTPTEVSLSFGDIYA